MDIAKSVGLAFAVGGCIGVVGQALVIAFSFTPLYSAGLTMFAVLISMGLLGAVMYLTGLYAKLDKACGMGVGLSLCGFTAAVAALQQNVTEETGSSAKAIAVIAIELFLKVAMVGVAVCAALGAIWYFTDLVGTFTVPYAPGGVVVENVGPPNGTGDGPPNGIPVGIDPASFVWAFLVGGVASALAQLVQMLTKIPMPVYLIALMGLGAFLIPFGAMKAIVGVAGGGAQVMIYGAGEAIASVFIVGLEGNPMPFIAVILLFVALFAIGIAAGAIACKVRSRGTAQM